MYADNYLSENVNLAMQNGSFVEADLLLNSTVSRKKETRVWAKKRGLLVKG
jgi:hypothetical protein